MNYPKQQQHTELRCLIGNLGQQGGLISPSVYDTAQVLRLTPEHDGHRLVTDWLIAQQQPDGGWGDPAVPRARDLPTLATILALYPGRNRVARASIQAGLVFLRDHAPLHWSSFLPDDIPVGAELLLPHLLTEAAQLGIVLPQRPYRSLVTLGQQRRQQIAQKRPCAGSAPAHSWETWGSDSHPGIIDGSGGVGHSPAATASWLHRAGHRPHLKNACQRAQQFLARATAATCTAYPGLLPTVWPINRFEQVWGLSAIWAAGLLDHPQLADPVQAQLRDLSNALLPSGLGMSDHFTQDGDITAMTIAILHAAGYPTDSRVVRRFQREDHFFSYPHELQPSLTTTAHAVLALALSGEDVSRHIRFLLICQKPDGRWVGDKWHSSWIYATTQVMLALVHARELDGLSAATEALLRNQHDNGGWGMGSTATAAETAYALLALRVLQSHGIPLAGVDAAMKRGAAWLSDQYVYPAPSVTALWIGKELYCPHRVEQALVLSALLGGRVGPGVPGDAWL